MDPFTITALATLASHVVGILTPLVPFLNKAGEAAATKIGEGAYEEGKHLYQVIHDRFVGEADNGKARRVLQNFTEDPEEYSPNLEKQLLQLLKADPEFAKTLSQILQSGPIQTMDFGDDAKIEDTHMNNELEQGSQTMHAGDKANFKNVSMNIGHKREKDN
jgi:hypothetical protein